MRTLFAATLVILAAILIAAASSFTDAATMLGYKTGCIFRRTLGRYNGDNYNTTTIAFNQYRAFSPSFLVQTGGSFEVNLFGGQIGLIGLVPGNPPLTSVNPNFCSDSSIKYTAGEIDASTIKPGQTYCVSDNANTYGTNAFVVNVVSISSNKTVIDVVALSINTPSKFNQQCFFVQEMGNSAPTRCATNEWTKISTPCN